MSPLPPPNLDSSEQSRDKTVLQRLHYPLALLTSMLVSYGLFYFMHYLTSNGEIGTIERQRDVAIEFIRLAEPAPTLKKPVATLKAPRPLDAPPPASAPEKMAVTNPDMNMEAFALPTLAPELSIEGIGFNLAPGSDEVIPTVRIQPQYPMRAHLQNKEGWVKVELTVTELGTVKDLRVVESHPAVLFDQATIRAVSRWKFKPRIVDGKAISFQHDLRVDFTVDDN